ncbi:uncharacterized protein BDCG_07628 [Blastomyces dermatitidis ER-3]|uniref:Uncharacterized protein n=1 Tax=Ajellomyces dermatitidis (strain ER-3 / ATCC MYA-2586) TaxID=559297 RepID=A0ABP2F5Z0_AJEDR|nr:uncharacterized protein BDCG_07628 [Blastomyces dermatitidis ER-3]EEQ92508.2 hypothetical protein BDCG_07628 [Blastomyces dermatitidis ER-3]EQL31567.1 hypothetical protein BDFG_06142 [Blastomyces dermatitidis ATCC 26199]
MALVRNAHGLHVKPFRASSDLMVRLFVLNSITVVPLLVDYRALILSNRR